MVVLGGWSSYVVVDEIDAIEVVCQEVYVMFRFLCVG